MSRLGDPSRLVKFGPDELRAHLAKGLAVRRERSRAKEMMRSGELSVEQALDTDCLQRVRVKDFLRAIPGIGAHRAVAIMEDACIAESRRVRGLGVRQRRALLKAVESYTSPDDRGDE